MDRLRALRDFGITLRVAISERDFFVAYELCGLLRAFYKANTLVRKGSTFSDFVRYPYVVGLIVGFCWLVGLLTS